jgi:hypothetical protein
MSEFSSEGKMSLGRETVWILRASKRDHARETAFTIACEDEESTAGLTLVYPHKIFV